MNYEKRQHQDIGERTIKYALRAIKLYQYLEKEKNGAGLIIGKQYLRSATSIGANLQEAKSGESRSDFIHKLSVSQKEARESLYWLKFLAKSEIINKEKMQDLIGETNEIIAVIPTILVKSKKNYA